MRKNRSSHPTSYPEALRSAYQALLDHLGGAVLILMTGSPMKTPRRGWCRGPKLTPQAEARVLVAHHAWETLTPAVNEQGARNWFLNPNPLLDQRSPLNAIRDGDYTRVIEASEAFTYQTNR